MAKNILTFDLEDWYHGNFLFEEYGKVTYDETRVVEPTETLLTMLRETNNKSTFFVLGEVAEKFPNLIKEIHNQGHEIASHCFEHKLVYDLTKEDFHKDLSKSKAILEDIIGEPIIGFRAPYWSINPDTHWVWDVLKENGIKYDSSLYPFKTYLYGDNNFPRFHHQIKTCVNGPIEEVPPSTLELLKMRIPFCGGFYFRLLPYWIIRWGFNSINKKEDNPGVFYLHPYEIDKNKPKSSKGFRNNFILHVNVKKAKKKLHKLFTDFDFVSVQEYYGFK